MNVFKSGKTLVVFYLAFFALLNSANWLLETYNQPYRGLDFRTYYLASKTYFEDLNPYKTSDQKLVWNRTPDKANYLNPKFDEHESVVYAPQFVWFFKLYNCLNFEQAKWVQLILNLLSLVIIILILNRLNPLFSIFEITIAIAALRSTWYALENGQPMIQILCLIFVAFYLLLIKNRHVIPGIILGICAFKFTLLIPVGLFLLVNKNYKTVIALILSSIILNALALANHLNAAEILSSWHQNIEMIWQSTHNINESNSLGILNTSLSYFFVSYFHIPSQALKISMPIILLFFTSIVIYKSQEIENTRQSLLVFSLIQLCFGQHMVYDIIVTATYFILSSDRTFNPKIHIPLMMAVTLPLGIINQLIPNANYVLNWTLLLYLLISLSPYLFNKNIEIKKPN